jgi:hypothetical protein
MVDDETRFVAEASRPETRMVTVAGDDQDVDAAGNRLHHFAFDASTSAEQRDVWTAESRGSRGEQIRGFVAGDSRVRLGWSASGGAASEEADGCRACCLGDV